MAILVLPVAFYMMAGLSSACSSIRVLVCNASASLLCGNKYTHTLYTVIPLWLASTWEWLGCLAWEIRMIVTLCCLESTYRCDWSLAWPALAVLCCNCDAHCSNDYPRGWVILHTYILVLHIQWHDNWVNEWMDSWLQCWKYVKSVKWLQCYASLIDTRLLFL